ncbi:MAG: zinc ribbon domain-containing protein [Eggerthellaceae bacterium]|nr:zinc ribbon domain-containing protein [Eggerthellaceae bacterium]
MYCANCGNEMAEEAKYCPNCGTSNGSPIVPSAGVVPQDNRRVYDDAPRMNASAPVAESIYPERGRAAKKGVSKPVLIGAVAMVVALVVCVGVFALAKGAPAVDFARQYNDIALERFCEIAEDGSYMQLDTNPLDIEDEVLLDAWYAIERVNEELGFPDSVAAKMGETRSLDGMQEAETEDVRVTWTYHPDNGLEVMYELKEA